MIEPNKLTPGPDLDRLVAERVMRYKLEDGGWWYGDIKVESAYWSPSTIREDALKVVDYFMALQCGVTLEAGEWYDGGRWTCRILHPIPTLAPEDERVLGEGSHEVEYPSEERPSLALAICRAAVDYAKKNGSFDQPHESEKKVR